MHVPTQAPWDHIVIPAHNKTQQYCCLSSSETVHQTPQRGVLRWQLPCFCRRAVSQATFDCKVPSTCCSHKWGILCKACMAPCQRLHRACSDSQSVFEGNLHSALASRCQSHCKELAMTVEFLRPVVIIVQVLCPPTPAGRAAPGASRIASRARARPWRAPSSQSGAKRCAVLSLIPASSRSAKVKGMMLVKRQRGWFTLPRSLSCKAAVTSPCCASAIVGRWHDHSCVYSSK